MTDKTEGGAPPRAPNPGSDEALALGCSCPVLDNNHGRGARRGPDGQVWWWWSGDCTLHVPKVASAASDPKGPPDSSPVPNQSKG